MVNEKKNALVFFGSPNLYGSTACVLKQLINCGREYFNFNIINAYACKFMPCYGCGYCRAHLNCKFNDFAQVNLLIEMSSVIIVATPIYNCSFPAPLKLIFDRFQPHFYAKKDKSNAKKALLVLTSGKSKEKSGIGLIYLQAKYVLKSINAEIFKTISLSNTDAKPIKFTDFKNKNEKITDLLKTTLKSLYYSGM